MTREQAIWLSGQVEAIRKLVVAVHATLRLHDRAAVAARRMADAEYACNRADRAIQHAVRAKTKTKAGKNEAGKGGVT